LPGLLLVAGGSGWFWWHYRHQRQPLLSGTLRRVSAPTIAGSALPSRLDLDTLNRREVGLGPDARAYLHLPHLPEEPTPSVRLVARRDPDSQPITALVVSETNEAVTVLINGVPVRYERMLRDGDTITLGAYRFKYENLRQRRQYNPRSRS